MPCLTCVYTHARTHAHTHTHTHTHYLGKATQISGGNNEALVVVVFVAVLLLFYYGDGRLGCDLGYSINSCPDVATLVDWA